MKKKIRNKLPKTSLKLIEASQNRFGMFLQKSSDHLHALAPFTNDACVIGMSKFMNSKRTCQFKKCSGIQKLLTKYKTMFVD